MCRNRRNCLRCKKRLHPITVTCLTWVVVASSHVGSDELLHNALLSSLTESVTELTQQSIISPLQQVQQPVSSLRLRTTRLQPVVAFMRTSKLIYVETGGGQVQGEHVEGRMSHTRPIYRHRKSSITLVGGPWNTLPEDTMTSQSLSTFYQRLKTYRWLVLQKILSGHHHIKLGNHAAK